MKQHIKSYNKEYRREVIHMQYALLTSI